MTKIDERGLKPCDITKLAKLHITEKPDEGWYLSFGRPESTGGETIEIDLDTATEILNIQNCISEKANHKKESSASEIDQRAEKIVKEIDSIMNTAVLMLNKRNIEQLVDRVTEKVKNIVRQALLDTQEEALREVGEKVAKLKIVDRLDGNGVETVGKARVIAIIEEVLKSLKEQSL